MKSGLTVVEVAVGTSELGLGLAGGVPGMLLASLGADVTRVTGVSSPDIDAGLPWGRVWHRDKRIVRTDDADEIAALLRDADVAIVYGDEDLVEGRRLGSADMTAANPRLVYVRCAPSRTAKGTVADYALLVEAQSGFCTQLDGHRPGPIVVDVRAPGSGAAFLITASALALLRRRALTGGGGWAETSLYDGLLATLGCMIGRSERAPTDVESYWEHGSTYPNFLYRCSDDELVQVWFGGKGMYAKLIEALGDEPSAEGYYSDQTTGALIERRVRWTATFATQPRAHWIERLRELGVACEPVLSPGEALGDPQMVEAGITTTLTSGGDRDVLTSSPITLAPLADIERSAPPVVGGRLLEGVTVVDFSAFVAGPLAAQVLADLGADVIKVEPPGGEAMRSAAYAVAACQRGKRSIALNISAPEARPVLDRLLAHADVVVHNFRVGVSERLGIDEAAVARLNPGAVYCHASAFGPTGTRARYPGNDALMQALTGFERAIGGAGNDPTAATWIPLDMTGGWVAAIGILAGLCERAMTGRGQRVATSLLGAGMLLQSGIFQRNGEVIRGPALDRQQTGYGPGHRIYEGQDGQWFALVVPNAEDWRRLSDLTGLTGDYVPLRSGGVDSPAEAFLEGVFATAPAAEWVGRLQGAGLLVQLIRQLSRDAFRQGILDDSVNRGLGRVVGYDTQGWGFFEQIGPLLRCGPEADGGPTLMLPGTGEHTVEVLFELGLNQADVDALLDAKIARQGQPL